METSGPFEARYVAFLATIANLRPSLHRYCSRMTGSVLDGEDVVQEALFQAYRMLDGFADSRPCPDIPSCRAQRTAREGEGIHPAAG